MEFQVTVTNKRGGEKPMVKLPCRQPTTRKQAFSTGFPGIRYLRLGHHYRVNEPVPKATSSTGEYQNIFGQKSMSR